MALTFSTGGIAAASARHPWRVIGLWVIGLLLSFFLVGSLLSGVLTTQNTFTNDPEAKVGLNLLEQRLRGELKDNEAIIIRSSSLTVNDAAFKSYVQSLEQQIKALGPDVIESIGSFYSSGASGLVSSDGRTTILPVVMHGNLDTATDNIAKVVHVVEEANGKDRFEAYIAGNASIGHDFTLQSEKDLQRSEIGSLPLAMIILVLVFGAVVAALVPMVLAAFAIVVALALTALIGQQFQFSFFVTNMIVMMGLAVGIDYCLFIVSRFREERANGLAVHEAVRVAGNTAGRAVLFSGLTVVIALAGLLIVPTTIFGSLGGGAILVVLAAIAASLTLLPAVLMLLGDRVNSVRLPFIQHAQASVHEETAGGFWDRVARTVMKHPVISLALAAGLLIAAAVPYADIHLGTNGVSTLPESFQSRKGFLILEEEFAGGQVYPAEVVIDGRVSSSGVQAAIANLKQRVAADKVFGPSTFEANPGGDLGLLSFQMAADPATDEAIEAIRRLRNDYIHQAFAGVDAKVYVTGLAAGNVDFFDLAETYTPRVFLLVLGLSFLLLMMVFRSIVVPVKAMIMNLLSVGAAYGLLVLVFQKGFLASTLGFQQVESLEAWLPIFLFSILFGLSMDYHVFLLSRIRERYDQTGNNTEAVAFGVRSTGRLITGAALIMVVVFGGFALGDLVMFQQMGFGLAVAVFLDATIIRSVLVPASMRLLGDLNWYMPSFLGWLPKLGVEEPAIPKREVVRV